MWRSFGDGLTLLRISGGYSQEMMGIEIYDKKILTDSASTLTWIFSLKIIFESFLFLEEF